VNAADLAHPDELLPGQSFEWCDRVVTVVSVANLHPRRAGQRDPGVEFTVMVDGLPRRLHYWRDELVRRVPT
jgi:hypothetical protein